MTAIGKKNRKNQFARLPAYSYSSKKKHAKETRKIKQTRAIHCIITYYYFMRCEISNHSKLLFETSQKQALQLQLFYYNCSYFITTAMQYFIFRFPEPVEFVKNFSQILLDSLTVRVPRCINISHSMKRKASPNNRKMFENVETNYHQARRSEEFIIFNACQKIIPTRQAELASFNNQL